MSSDLANLVHQNSINIIRSLFIILIPVLQVIRRTPEESDNFITTIDSKKFEGKRDISLRIPTQLLRLFINQSGDKVEGQRLTSFIFENVEDLFRPEKTGCVCESNITTLTGQWPVYTLETAQKLGVT